MEPIMDWSGISWNWEYNFYYYNLAKLIFWGLIPMALLIFFNFKVYFGMESTKTSLQTKKSNEEVCKKRNYQPSWLSLFLFSFYVTHWELLTGAMCSFWWILIKNAIMTPILEALYKYNLLEEFNQTVSLSWLFK